MKPTLSPQQVINYDGTNGENISNCGESGNCSYRNKPEKVGPVMFLVRVDSGAVWVWNHFQQPEKALFFLLENRLQKFHWKQPFGLAQKFNAVLLCSVSASESQQNHAKLKVNQNE